MGAVVLVGHRSLNWGESIGEDPARIIGESQFATKPSRRVVPHKTTRPAPMFAGRAGAFSDRRGQRVRPEEPEEEACRPEPAAGALCHQEPAAVAL
jgi:hypothetical protein